MSSEESIICRRLLEKLEEMLGSGGPIALHEPLFRGHESDYVQECISTGWVSSVGKFVDEFEQKLAEYTGVKRAVAVVNGTSALHMCLLLAGVEREDEVLVPALTFVATANAVVYCGAVPHFVDSAYDTLGVDPQKLSDYLADLAVVRSDACFNRQTGRRIRAVVPMHTFGHPVDMDALNETAARYHLVVVEDCAESIGSLYKGRHTGNFGKVAAMSFNGNKIITTGGGGAILTNDEELGRLAKHLTTQAKRPHRWEFSHDAVGYNYRMPNINAALGYAQLEQIDGFLAKKRALAMGYKVLFRDIGEAEFFVEPSFARSNYWLNAVLLRPEHADLRDEVLDVLNESGIMVRPVWNLMTTLSMYASCPRMDLSQAEDIGRRLINLPSSVKLGGAFL